jgi:hypothetical protein
MSRWRNYDEREETLQDDCERFCSRLELRKSDERDGHGRWILKGPWTWAEVVTLSNGLYVGGDIETVVFHGGPEMTLRGRVYWMATTSYYYAAQKARAGDTGGYEWDAACAAFAVCDHRRRGELEKGQARAIFDAIADGEHHFQAALYEEDDGSLSEMYGMGQVVPKRVFMATAVLRRLVWLFESQELRQKSREWFRRAA